MHYHPGSACNHHHGAANGPDRQRDKRRLTQTLVLVSGYMVVEVVAGLWTGSLALLADAGHMLSDAAALALSLFAIWIAQRPATSKHTYGFHRAEILAALANAVSLIVIAIFIFIEAVERIQHPYEVKAPWMIGVAFVGLLINLIGLIALHSGKSSSLNVHGAWLHVLGDALGSVAAVIAGLLIWQFGWYWADPVASIAIGLLVIYSSFSLLRMTVFVLMQGTPAHLDLEQIRTSMLAVPGVMDVHTLHVWTITSGMESLSAHVAADESRSSHQMLVELRDMLHREFGIDHITLQIEPEHFHDHAVPWETASGKSGT